MPIAETFETKARMRNTGGSFGSGQKNSQTFRGGGEDFPALRWHVAGAERKPITETAILNDAQLIFLRNLHSWQGVK